MATLTNLGQTLRNARHLPVAGAALVLVAAMVLLLRGAPPATAPPEIDEPAAAAEHDGGMDVPPDLEPRVSADPLPPFDQLEPGPERKDAFIDFVAPVASEINAEIEQRRAALRVVEQRLEEGRELDEEAAGWLDRMVLRYRVAPGAAEKQVEALKPRIDTIPVSLAVAQAALESGWGSSRFAREGNSLYGKWCFTSGCGIVPGNRPDGATHELETYEDAADATRAYMLHLNSHPVYETLRERRQTAREAGRRPEGADLAAGLELYSARGEAYVRSVRGVIRANDLEELAADDQSAGSGR